MRDVALDDRVAAGDGVEGGRAAAGLSAHAAPEHGQIVVVGDGLRRDVDARLGEGPAVVDVVEAVLEHEDAHDRVDHLAVGELRCGLVFLVLEDGFEGGYLAVPLGAGHAAGAIDHELEVHRDLLRKDLAAATTLADDLAAVRLIGAHRRWNVDVGVACVGLLTEPVVGLVAGAALRCGERSKAGGEEESDGADGSLHGGTSSRCAIIPYENETGEGRCRSIAIAVPQTRH